MAIMKMLFMHYSFPGQFKHLLELLSQDPNNEIIFICHDLSPQRKIPGVKKLSYQLAENKTKIPQENYLYAFSEAIEHGKAVWECCSMLKEQGFVPDFVYAHSAWGQAMFIKDIYPDVPYIAYMEYYFHAFGADMHFYPDEPTSPDRILHTRIRNSNHLINLEACDWAISPTRWQANLYPPDFHHKFSVIHEGVNVEKVKPFQAEHPLPLNIPKDAEIMTYVSRNFEPYRGFVQAIQAIDKLMKKRPQLHVIMVGGDKVSYGRPLPDGRSYREVMLEKLDLDETRIHWTGQVNYNYYLQILNASQLHLYMTIPFMISWSLVESMAMACPIVASNTEPVREFITDNHNGRLTEFFDQAQLVANMEWMLDHKEEAKKLGEAARNTVIESYNHEKILPRYTQLIKDISQGKIKPPLTHPINTQN